MTSAAKPKAIVAHPIWGRGGAESAAMWIIAALQRDFRVTVYTRGGFDLTALNALAGTAIAPASLHLRHAKAAHALPLGALAHGAYLRSLHRVGADYALRVTASGVMHWGHPAVHFLSSATWNAPLAERFGVAPTQRKGHRARAALYRLGETLSGRRHRPLDSDIFIANSDWTARQSAPFCAAPIPVIAPAVPLPPRIPAWEARETGILVLGRISPEKRIETCIDIVERVRAAGWPLHLCLAGPDGEADYAQAIATLCAPRADWITRVPLVTGAAKQALLHRYRYGLSACDTEAFGIATAEMAASGMIVLAPAQGGQREILTDPRHLYRHAGDAAQRMTALLGDDALQKELHAHAIAAGDRFAPAQFMDAVRAAIGARPGA